MEISIHALREEGDLFLMVYFRLLMKFLSTPSARRATQSDASASPYRVISIHALREEGDPTVSLDHRLEAISIHALREEGDGILWTQLSG